ncbi:MAG TPA: hypothetical protein VI136_04880 [Verrucomicrobiae bacterium]
MGWGRMLLLGNVGQQLDIGDLSKEIATMQSAFASNVDVDHEQGKAIQQLQAENRELKRYLATLIRLLVAKGVVKPEEVETTVQAVER